MNFMFSPDSALPVFRALLGIIGLLGIAYLISSDRKMINFRVVLRNFLTIDYRIWCLTSRMDRIFVWMDSKSFQ